MGHTHSCCVLQCHRGPLSSVLLCVCGTWQQTETFIERPIELKYTFSFDNWVAFQVANLSLHSNTNRFSPLTVKTTFLSEQWQNQLRMAALWNRIDHAQADGLLPARSVRVSQSYVQSHPTTAWLLPCPSTTLRKVPSSFLSALQKQ